MPRPLRRFSPSVSLLLSLTQPPPNSSNLHCLAVYFAPLLYTGLARRSPQTSTMFTPGFFITCFKLWPLLLLFFQTFLVPFSTPPLAYYISSSVRRLHCLFYTLVRHSPGAASTCRFPPTGLFFPSLGLASVGLAWPRVFRAQLDSYAAVPKRWTRFPELLPSWEWVPLYYSNCLLSGDAFDQPRVAPSSNPFFVAAALPPFTF